MAGTGVLVSWVDTVNTNQTGYVVERKVAPGGYDHLANAPGAATRSYTDTAPVVGQSNCYVVYSRGTAGPSGFSPEACVQVGAPPGPAGRCLSIEELFSAADIVKASTPRLEGPMTLEMFECHLASAARHTVQTALSAPTRPGSSPPPGRATKQHMHVTDSTPGLQAPASRQDTPMPPPPQDEPLDLSNDVGWCRRCGSAACCARLGSAWQCHDHETRGSVLEEEPGHLCRGWWRTGPLEADWQCPTCGRVVRLAPPARISQADFDWSSRPWPRRRAGR